MDLDEAEHPENHAYWDQFFRDSWVRELAYHEGGGPVSARNNAEGRRHWWSAPGCTLAAVLEYIEGGWATWRAGRRPSRGAAGRPPGCEEGGRSVVFGVGLALVGLGAEQLASWNCFGS